MSFTYWNYFAIASCIWHAILTSVLLSLQVGGQIAFHMPSRCGRGHAYSTNRMNGTDLPEPLLDNCLLLCSMNADCTGVSIKETGTRCVQHNRRPDSESNGIEKLEGWVYIEKVIPGLLTETCQNYGGESECVSDAYGFDYKGSIAKAVSSAACQRWDAVPSNFTASNFPEQTISETGNRCRNPDFSPYGPWCYIHPGVREPCALVYCRTFTRISVFGNARLQSGVGSAIHFNLNSELIPVTEYEGTTIDSSSSVRQTSTSVHLTMSARSQTLKNVNTTAPQRFEEGSTTTEIYTPPLAEFNILSPSLIDRRLDPSTFRYVAINSSRIYPVSVSLKSMKHSNHYLYSNSTTMEVSMVDRDSKPNKWVWRRAFSFWMYILERYSGKTVAMFEADNLRGYFITLRQYPANDVVLEKRNENENQKWTIVPG